MRWLAGLSRAPTSRQFPLSHKLVCPRCAHGRPPDPCGAAPGTRGNPCRSRPERRGNRGVDSVHAARVARRPGPIDMTLRRWTDDELERWRRKVALLAVEESADLPRDDTLAVLGELQELRSRLAAIAVRPSQQGWMPSDSEVREAQAIFFEDLPPLALDGLTKWLVAEDANGRESEPRRIFGDALYDLSALLDEVRFEVGVAAMYISGRRRPFTMTSGVASTGSRRRASGTRCGSRGRVRSGSVAAGSCAGAQSRARPPSAVSRVPSRGGCPIRCRTS